MLRREGLPIACIGLAVVAALLALLALPGRAHALQDAPYVATDTQNLPETSRLVESQGAYDVPGTPASPGSVGTGAGWSNDGLTALQDLPTPGTSTTSDSIWEELLRLEQASKEVPSWVKWGKFTLGGVAGTVVLIGGSYVVGKIFSPADPPAGPIWNINAFGILGTGDTIPRQCYVTVHCTDQTTVAYKLPWPSRVFSPTAQSNQRDFYYCVGGNNWGSYSSPEAVLGPLPQGATAVETYTEAPIGAGTCGNHTWQHFSIIDPIGPGEFSPLGAPIGPDEGGSQIGTITINPCTVNWPDCPTSSNLSQRIADELNSGNEPELSKEVDHDARPDLFPDPTLPETTNPNDHRCELTKPSYENHTELPGGHDRYDPYYATPFVTSGRPPGALDEPDPYLRWGSATAGGGTLDNWTGWGWRYIQAKHGWSEADRQATISTLADPDIAVPDDPENPTDTTMIYESGIYRQNGAECDRVVVVQFDPATGPKGIINSYGNYLDEAP